MTKGKNIAWLVLVITGIVIILICSFFASYSVFASLITLGYANMLNEVSAILGMFAIQIIGVITWKTIKSAIKFLQNKVGYIPRKQRKQKSKRK